MVKERNIYVKKKATWFVKKLNIVWLQLQNLKKLFSKTDSSFWLPRLGTRHMFNTGLYLTGSKKTLLKCGVCLYVRDVSNKQPRPVRMGMLYLMSRIEIVSSSWHDRNPSNISLIYHRTPVTHQISQSCNPVELHCLLNLLLICSRSEHARNNLHWTFNNQPLSIDVVSRKNW